MATQGPNNPGTLADDPSNGGTQTWNNPGNAQVSDNVYATAVMTGGSNETDYLKVTNFLFSIPAGATINGITLDIERKDAGGASASQDSVVKLVKGGTVVGSNKNLAPNWPTTDTFQSYGGVADLWGTTWTVTDINASNFGAVLSVFGNGLGGAGAASVDNMRITVTYTDTAQGFSIALV